MSINVETIFAHECDECLAAFLREIDREAGGSRYGDHDRNATGERFLHDFEGGATAHDEDLFVERKQGIEQRVAEDFIYCVVAADVFSNDDGSAILFEESGGMEAARAVECFLLKAQFCREIDEELGRNGEGGVNRGKCFMYGVDGGRTAKSAARRSKDVPGEFCKIDRNIGREKKVDGVARWIARVGHDLRDLLAVGDQAFGEEEASGQFIIMAGCAHGDADRARFDLDFERLFGSDGIVGLRGLGLEGPAEDRPVFGAEGGAVFVNAPAVH